MIVSSQSIMEIIFLIFIVGLLVPITSNAIKKKNLYVLFLFVSITVICLIRLYSLILSMGIIIDGNILFQINATIIAGALILLTITSFLSKDSHKPIIIPIFGKNFAFTPYQAGGGMLVAFSLSSLFLFMNDLLTAEIMDCIGFIWLVITGIIITVKEQFDQEGASN